MPLCDAGAGWLKDVRRKEEDLILSGKEHTVQATPRKCHVLGTETRAASASLPWGGQPHSPCLLWPHRHLPVKARQQILGFAGIPSLP